MPLIWKDGKRIEGSLLELAAQLRQYAELANKEYMIRSSWHAHIGEQLEEAAKEIERLSAPLVPGSVISVLSANPQ